MDYNDYRFTELLFKAFGLYPELRIGQLFVNAAHKAGWEQDDIFYCPNTTLKKGIIMLIEERENK